MVSHGPISVAALEGVEAFGPENGVCERRRNSRCPLQQLRALFWGKTEAVLGAEFVEKI